jgi:hypothetical protein
MNCKSLARILILVLAVVTLAACGAEQAVDVKTVTSQPKAFVGSDTCKQCHLEHYDSWKMTMHSRMTQDAVKNRDAIIVPIDEKRIRADLAKLDEKLTLPPDKLKQWQDKLWIPTIDDIKITIGSQWKQRYIVEKEGVLYIAPIQYNADTDRWVNYHRKDWDKRPWMKKCGGCHATGVDIDKQSYSELGVACEACHGKGSWHAALPKTQVFEKRETIINPAKLTMGVAVQICGSCHNRGKATQYKGAGWPVGYQPGKALGAFYKSTSFEAGDVKHVYANEFSKGHHQQFIDWQQSKHASEGVTCTSCHYVHQIGVPPTRSQTLSAGSKQCFACHVQVNSNIGHSIHSFANCIGCHMPRIAKSAESGDIHSHVFVTLLPEDTMRNPKLPNSCQTCHKHKYESLERLQREWEALAKIPSPRGKVIEELPYHRSPKPKK